MSADRPTKITFADMRGMGVRGLLIFCSDHHCSHLVTMSGDRWPDEMRLSDLESPLPRSQPYAQSHKGMRRANR